MKREKGANEGVLEELKRLRQRVAELEQAEVERKRAEEEARQATDKLQTIFDSVNDGLAIMDKGLTVKEVNKYRLEALGLNREQVVGRKCHEAFQHRDEPCEVCPVQPVFEKGEMVRLEKSAVLQDGTVKYFDAQGTPIFDDKGNVLQVISSIRDVTERKRAEQALRQERDRAERYLNIAGVMFVAINAKEEVALINEKGCETLGYEHGEIIGKNWFDNFLPARIRNEVKSVFQELMAGEVEPVEYFENPVLAKSGEERMIAWHNTVLRDDEGNITGALSSGEDITERRRAEEALKESEQHFRSLIENALDGVMIVDGTGIISYQSPSIRQILGYKPEEVVGERISDFIHSEETPDTMKAFNQLAQNPDYTQSLQLRVRHKDGSLRIIEGIGQNLLDNSYIRGIVINYRDITERKRAEEALGKSEEKYRSLVSNVKLGVFRSTPEPSGKFLEVNPAMEEITGYSREDLVRMNAVDLYVRPEERAAVLEELAAAVGKAATHELSFRKKDGTEIVVSDTKVAVTDDAGKLLYSDGIIEDITQRKRAEEALRESEERNRALVDVAGKAGEAIAVVQDTEDTQGVIVFVNEEFPTMLGYSQQELLGKPFHQFISPDSLSTVGERYRRRQKGERVRSRYEVMALRKDGTAVPIDVAAGTMTFRGKVATVTFWRDITERKQAEEALGKSEEKYRSLVNNVKLGIFRSTPGPFGKFVEVNPAMEEITGYPREELLRMNVSDLYVRPEEREVVLEEIATVGGKATRELNFRRKDRTEIVVSDTKVAVRDDTGKVVYFDGIIEDITQRKRAEEALQASARQWRATFDGIGDAVSLMDLQGRILRCNTAMTHLLGKPFDEITGQTCWKLVHGTSQPVEGCPVVRMWETRRRETLAMPIGDRWLQVTADPLLDETGNLIGTVHIMADITERKKAEERIKASLKEKEVLLKEINHRVKNNLQVMSSLLKLQSQDIKDERYAEMLNESQNRVKTMALIHDRLCQSPDLARIDLGEYIKSLVRSLFSAYRADAGRIALRTEVEDIRLGVTHAMPCGLTINELVSNSLKHAFPKGKKGEIEVALRWVDQNEIELVVSDNGIGIPESLDFRNAGSLGLRLVTMLVEDQLGGQIELDRTEGTKVQIKFRVVE